MSWRQTGRAFAKAQAPEAFAVCDRCGFWYNRGELRWQFDWTGPRLMNLRILVCRPCHDKPFEHNRPLSTPPDPVPLMNPRADTYAVQFSGPILLDEKQEVILDTSGAPISDTGNMGLNVPPYPFSGFTMLRSPFGGTVNQVDVRDDAYAVQSTTRNAVQVTGIGGVPIFSTQPSTNPKTAYNNQNITTANVGYLPAQYDFPVVLDVED